MTARATTRRVAEAAARTPYRVGIYVRISKDREGRTLGVQRQEELCRAKLERDGGNVVVDVYSDNDMGASTRTKVSRKKRHGYNRMFADVRAGRINKIVAYSASRLTRRPLEFEGQIELAEKYGVVYEFVKSPTFDLATARGREFARGMAARDTGEVEDTSERVCDEKAQRRANGEYSGGARAFGWEGAKYDDDGVILNKKRVGRVPVPHEAEMIKDAIPRVLGGESLYAIAKEWTARGVLTSKGSTRWTESSVKKVLTNPRHAGLIAWCPDWREGGATQEILEGVTAEWQKIIEPDDLRALTVRLSGEERRTYDGSRSLKWLGTNLYWCAECGSLARSAGESSVGADGEKHAAYRCKDGLHLSIRAAPVDDMVNAAACNLLLQRGIDLIDRSEDKDGAARLHERANTLQQKYIEIGEMYDDDEIDKPEYLRRRARNRAQLDEVNAELESYSTRSVLSGVADALDPAAAYMAAPIDRQRAIVDTLFIVCILKGKRGRPARGTDPFEWRLVIFTKDVAAAPAAKAA